MKSKFEQLNFYRLFSLLTFACLLFMGTASSAQTPRACDGERATCKIKVNDKIYEPPLNQVEYFARITHLEPSATLLIEVNYPDGSVGEKIVVSAEDGGKFDNNKIVEVKQLDDAKNISFEFQVGNSEGLYRVNLRKGDDRKVVRIYVGSVPPVTHYE